jgi:hypothetical protein
MVTVMDRPEIGWRSATTATGSPPVLLTVWVPCGTCWGQRRIFRFHDGHYLRLTCPACLGLGDVSQGER